MTDNPYVIEGSIQAAENWLGRARDTLFVDLDGTKRQVQLAKKLIDEAIVDLDGLIQDQKGTDATRS